MRVLIVGTGLMAGQHAKAFQRLDGVDLVATVEIDPDRRATFADQYGIAQTFETVETALDWGQFDAVSNATPDGVHKVTTLPFLTAGKHVLCEKPLATNYADAAEMTKAAQDAGVVNMVNLSYRNVSALQAARQAVMGGEIGEVRHIEASYLQSWLTQPAWGDWRTESAWLWRLSTAHGSHGVLGDVGIHILDFACFAAGLDVRSVSAALHTFDKAPGGKIGDYTLDANDSSALTCQLENGALAAIHASRFASGHLNDLSLKVFGTNGGIEITNAGGRGTMRICRQPDLQTTTWADVPLDPVPTNFKRFVDAVQGNAKPDPDFAYAARLQAVLDASIRSNAEGRRIDLAD